METTLRDERGSALILAMVAMLIMGTLALSFALLASLEAAIGVDGTQQAQAEALADAGLDRARDALRAAADEPCGFTRWTAATPPPGCGAPHGALLFGNERLRAGQYSAVVDNDCGPVLVPAAIQDPACAGAAPAGDENGLAVVTAFATAGTGRARVRALVAIDSPWRHVCAGHRADRGGSCSDQGRASGTPALLPADPSEPAGPRVFDDLPRPILGCSRIDPLLHRGALAAGAQATGCGDHPAMYPAPYPTAPGAPPRLVIMGEDPAVTPGARDCGADGAGTLYFGHFDCALTTPCPADVCGTVRKACVRAGDPRLADPASYASSAGGCGANTGMVFVGDQSLPAIGAPGAERDVYVLSGLAQLPAGAIWGTVVVEGRADAPGCPASRAFQVAGGAALWSGPAGAASGAQFGYPLALLVYSPDLAPPPAEGTPQPLCALLGGPGAGSAAVHGLVYSAGGIDLDAVALDGGLVAFALRAPGISASARYGSAYGSAAPAPGFPPRQGDQVRLRPKSFVSCAGYADDSAGGSACP